MLDKSPDAFRTISEVADDLDLPQHVLRFWETRFPQIKPMKRGGGRRYYRPEDIDLLKGIRHLLYDHGYTIKGVQKLLKTNGNKFVISIGHGDLASVQALTGGPPEGGDAAEPRVGMSEEDQVVGRAKPPITRRFFNFGGGDEESPEISIGKSSVGKEDRALLQEALYDLLECKRLLDQVR
ncbi:MULTISPECIES: MerR family transcriptional regulator [unclassified Rhizobium]|uniref:MerR family transcriptional regulator n=1 Tax=unclassified Rhizobium TaxID=2613769 RepID=UPI000363C20A|nr:MULTISPECIES: MerR family transcriptional regulator [unclassified Rhizobium]MBD9448712.1 MerR family transcriptional regulator [Rhizobium sp. RHZ01]MBD9451921.1 MerR family transcriptional regulator [Rhizobium sp. RHZ02]NMN69966.1 putative transcriptional regulators [Rhizobium sp. 57MFTsu3.2]